MNSEAEIIDKFFRNLSQNPYSLNLLDDAAVIPFNDHFDYVVTKDMMTQESNFLPSVSPPDLSFKLLSTNVSDLVAMGATPAFYLLGCSLPQTTTETWLAQFNKGLKDAQDLYQILLIGGDLNLTNHDRIVLSITAIGNVVKGKAITRSNAKVGDHIYISGAIGDAYIGLQIAQGKFSNINHSDQSYFLQKFNRPSARTDILPLLQQYASSAIDISDGLLKDLHRLTSASNVGASVDLSKIPLSDATKTLLATSSLPSFFYSQGDDYQILFTSSNPNLPLPKIGSITPSLGLFDSHGITLSPIGYDHTISHF